MEGCLRDLLRWGLSIDELLDTQEVLVSCNDVNSVEGVTGEEGRDEFADEEREEEGGEGTNASSGAKRSILCAPREETGEGEEEHTIRAFWVSLPSRMFASLLADNKMHATIK